MQKFGMQTLIIGLGLVALAAVAGCGGGRPYAEVRSDFVEFSPVQQREIADRAGREYRIQEGDILQVAFSYLKELNQEGVVVLDDGSINLIGVDRVEVAGLTVTEADSILTVAYGRDYRDPDLSILIQETRGRRVYVLGEVRNPGMYHVPAGGFDLLGAVTSAGGFTDDAAEEGSVLVRVTDRGYLVQEVDLANFGSGAAAGLALVSVEAHDIIYVPRTRVGDFAYFAKSVLSGVVQITRIASDIRYLTGGGIGRF